MDGERWCTVQGGMSMDRTIWIGRGGLEGEGITKDIR